MWAITAYFNPQNYQSRYKNYKIFRRRLDIPLITIELSFNNNFQLASDDADILIQISSSTILWQKERLLNLAIKKVPLEVKNIAWIDCDIFFESPDWPKKAEEALKQFNVIQLFSEASFLKAGKDNKSKENILDTRTGIIAFNKTHNMKDKSDDVWNKTLHPGFAWAAKKSLLMKHTFYDAMIIGGGDSALAYALYGKFNASKKHHFLSNLHFKHYLDWATPFNEDVDGKIGYIDEKIYHLWHGEIKNRKYFSRNKRLCDLKFNPYRDIKINKNGSWEWHNASSDLKSYLLSYFKNRKEDGS